MFSADTQLKNMPNHLAILIMDIRECLKKQNAAYSASLDGAAASLH